MTDNNNNYAERVRLWIQHLKWVKRHPKKEESEEFYQKEIDKWETRLQDLKEGEKK
jgi:hypothetical protein